MKHSIRLASTLLALGSPLSAQALCDRYPNTTLTLNTPATITVPDNLPHGSVIAEVPFSGSAPAFIANCTKVANRLVTARYPNNRFPGGSLVYRTEVPGVGLRIEMTWADGAHAAFFSIHPAPPLYTYPGKYPSFTSARAYFYKMEPVTTGTINSGDIWSYRWSSSPNTFKLRFGNSIRFVKASATCDLAAGDVNRTITLPDVQLRDFNAAITAGARNFELTANCTNASNVTFRFSGPPAANDDWRFANTGTAKGISLWLYSRIGGVNQTLRANGTDSARTIAVSGNRAVLPLGAAYFKNGTVGQGTLVSTATVNITYN